jgi:hypothetical protein
MTASSRYYIDENGKEWFAVRKREEDELLPTHWKLNPDCTLWWEPVGTVQITDELACSRHQLGPVYVTNEKMLGFLMYAQIVTEKLSILQLNRIRYLDSDCPHGVHGSGPVTNSSSDPYRLATLKELQEAGIE